MYRPKRYFSFFAMMAYSVSNTLSSFQNSVEHLIKERIELIKIVLISNNLQSHYQSRYKNI